MRFQLDPRARPLERRLPPPPTVPSAPAEAPSAGAAQALPPLATPAAAPRAPSFPGPAAAPLSAPSPGPAAPVAATAGAASRRSRVRLYAIVAVVLLLAGGATASLYLAEMPPFEYPRRYMLEGRELPRDMALVDMPAEARGEMGVSENPGRIDEDRLGMFAAGGRVPEPEDAWVEALGHRASEDPVVVVALKFRDEDHASRWASLAGLAACSGDTAILRDGAVVVVVGADGDAQPYLGRVVRSLREEAPDLAPVCGVA